MPEIVQRPVDDAVVARLRAAGCHARLARIYAARGLAAMDELATTLQSLVPPQSMHRVDEAARLLADAIAGRGKLLIVADYDADGATACAVGVKALRAMGAVVDYLVPNRRIHGYGLTPEIAREAAQRTPQWLITVDNGIAAVDGIAEAKRLGMRVLVTDPHLPGARPPEAACIVNPNQPGCGFPSKHIAGVGVIFYVMLALRAELRRRNAFTAANPEPNLAELLDLVALGTVADVVKLDGNNRILVAQGLARIRAGKASPGVAALLSVAGRDARRVVAADLAFSVGPRLNAAGRLEDMATGIECLIARDHGRAHAIAMRLDALNRERREIESKMQDSALAMVDTVEATDTFSLTMYHPGWHPGVVGLLASRLKDRFNKPVFAFAAESDGTLRGSGRSIAALHLRDALDRVDKMRPGLLVRFGGHAAAAGATLRPGALSDFGAALEAVAREALTPADLAQRIETDGALDPGEMTFDLAGAIQSQVWGQGFPEPRFVGRFTVEAQRVVAERHLKATLAADGRRFSAIRFGCADALPPSIEAVYRLDVESYMGEDCLQLTLEYVSEGAGAR
jgi:single-stranded-DNA-specific exonuclease